jgi:hypothetical protein
MKRLKLSLNLLFCKTNVNRDFLTIWCSDLQEAEDLWQKVYLLDGWHVEQPLEVKWNWKRFDYLYAFRVSKHLAYHSSPTNLSANTLFR